jgi:hydrogenase/urease accessory protein HupE
MLGPDFNTWLKEGFFHIITPEALDHILFITALCLSYTFKEWKKILLLVTAFTLGHSVTLIFTALGYINLPMHWVEFFIPLTIAITAAAALLSSNKRQPGRLIYSFALFFGLVHGLAYGANGVGSLYQGWQAVGNVLAFNLGIEGGQVLVVAAYMLLSFIFVQLLNIPKQILQKVCSAAILSIAVYWTFKKFPV